MQSGRNPYKPEPMKIGDDVYNTDHCGAGQKFNMKLGRCIPSSAFVDQNGIVNMAHSSNESLSSFKPPSVETDQTPTPEEAVKAEGAKRVKAKTAKQALGQKIKRT